MNAVKQISFAVAACAAFLAGVSAKADGFASPSVAAGEVMTLTGDVEISVPAGATNHIEFLLGGNHTITKTGGGCLEIGIITNSAVSIDVQAGTLSFTDPKPLVLTNTVLHLDASRLQSLATVTANGTNYVTRWSDADGGSVFASTLDGRPDPFLVDSAYSGRKMIDFGTMYSAVEIESPYSETLAGGYGAAFSLSSQCKCYDWIWVAQDREEVKSLVSGASKDIPGPAAFGLSTGHGNGGRGSGCRNNVPRLHSDSIAGACRGAYYYQNGLETAENWNVRLSEGQVNVVYHDATQQKTTDESGGGDRRTIGDRIGAHGTGGFTTSGGLRVGEVFLFNRLLTEEERRLTVMALVRKWRGMPLASLSVADGATLQLNGRKITATSFSSSGSFAGDGSVACPSYASDGANYTNTVPFAVSSDVISADFVTKSPANPGYEFSGDGTVKAVSDTQLEWLSASGRISKTGAGRLKVVAIGSGVTDIDVKEGELAVSPLANDALAFHADVSDRSSLTVDENADGTNYVTRIGDLTGSGNCAVTYPGNITLVGTERPVPNPFIASETANGLPLLDFGPLASLANPEGYGAAMKISSQVAAIRTFYVVAKDRPEVKNYAIPSETSSGFFGPNPVSGNYMIRGEGGNGSSCRLNYSGLAGSHKTSAYFCNGADIVWSARVGDGLNVLSRRTSITAEEKNYQWSLDCIGGNVGVATAATVLRFASGGCLFGETMACNYWQQDAVMAQVNAALMHKWKGTSRAIAYDSLSVAQGAVFRQDDADVTVGALSGQGTVASPVTLASGGTINLTLADDFSDNCLSVSGPFVLGGTGVLHVDADWANLAKLNGTQSVKVVDCSSVSGSTTGWTVTSTSPDRPLRGSLRIAADGLYADIHYPGGLSIIFR